MMKPLTLVALSLVGVLAACPAKTTRDTGTPADTDTDMAEEHAWSAEVQSVLFPQPVPQPDQDAGIVAQDGMSAGQKVTLTGR